MKITNRFEAQTRDTMLPGIPKARSLVAVSALCLAAGMGLAQSTPTLTAHEASGASSRQASAAFQAAMQDLPLSFQPDMSAGGDPGRFLASGAGYRLHLSATLAEIDIAKRDRLVSADLRMSVAGANPQAQVVGLDRLPTTTNYIVDADPQHSRTNVPNFAKVAYRNVYPGVDLSYYGNRGQLEYDFAVAPGANPAQIKLTFPGIAGMQVDAPTGDLVITLRDGSEVRHQRPQVYQQASSRKVTIDGRYHVLGANSVGFTLGQYDHALPLIIDPTVSFTRFIKGTGTDFPTAITVDSGGNTYIAGETDSLRGFPYGGNINVVTDVLPQKNCALAGGDGFACPNAAFLIKMNPAGVILAYSYFGGNGFDEPLAITTDNTWVYVAGETTSRTFNDAYTDPAESGPLKINGISHASGSVNAFVAIFEPNMIPFKYITFGGSGLNSAHAIAVDAAHFIYVAGGTCGGGDFPTSALLSKSVLQGAAGGGCDGYVVKMDLHGSIQAGYSTYIGGANNDVATAIAPDSDGSAWVTGYTCSPDFPGARLNPVSTGDLTNGGCTAFVTKLSPTGTSAEVSMFLGGRLTLNQMTDRFIYPNDFGTAITLAPGGGVVVAGGTYSPNFYTTSNSAVQKTNPTCLSGGVECESGWVARIGASGGVYYSTYLGGEGASYATTVSVNHNAQVYVGGVTSTYLGFPGAPAITPNPTAGYVTKLPDSLNSVAWTTFLGEEIHGLVARQPSPVWYPTGAPPTTIYTTGIRLVPKGTNPKLDTTAGTDGFVVQLIDGSAATAQ